MGGRAAARRGRRLPTQRRGPLALRRGEWGLEVDRLDLPHLGGEDGGPGGTLGGLLPPF